MGTDRADMMSRAMTRFLAIAVMAGLGVAVAACETRPPLRTDYDFDKTASFQAYKTYAWVGGARL